MVEQKNGGVVRRMKNAEKTEFSRAVIALCIAAFLCAGIKGAEELPSPSEESVPGTATTDGFEMPAPPAVDEPAFEAVAGEHEHAEGGSEALPDGPARQIQYVNWRELLIPCSYESRGVAPIVGMRLWWTEDEGHSWQLHPRNGTLKPQESIAFTAPGDGKYGFRLQVFDSVGNASQAPVPGDRVDEYVVVDTVNPDIKVLSPTPGREFYAGEVVRLAWNVIDRTLTETPVRIFYSPGDKKIDVPLRTEQMTFPARGELRWPLPLVKGTITFRLEVQDQAMNRSEVFHGPFTIVPYEVRRGRHEVVAEALSSSRKVPVFYRFQDIDQQDIGTVALYWYGADYKDGETEWKRGGEDPDCSSPVVFHAHRDGLFGLSVVVENKSGDVLRSLPKKRDADTVVLVDTHDPQIEILSVRRADSDDREGWLRAGEAAEIEFRIAEDNLTPDGVSIEYSFDGGAVWGVLAEDLGVEPNAPFVYVWNVPRISTNNLLVRVVAVDKVGNTSSVSYGTPLKIKDPNAADDVVIHRLLRKAQLFLQRKRLEESKKAVEALNELLGFDPENAEACLLLARAYVDIEKWKAGLQALGKAAEHAPGTITTSVEFFALLEKLLHYYTHLKTPDPLLLAEINGMFQKVSRKQLFQSKDFDTVISKYEHLERELHRIQQENSLKLERSP